MNEKVLFEGTADELVHWAIEHADELADKCIQIREKKQVASESLMSYRQRMLKDRERRVENKKRMDKLPWTQAEESVRTRRG